VSENDSGLISFLKDRYEQLKQENEELRRDLSELKARGLPFRELFAVIQELKVATIRQFVNKSHAELDFDVADNDYSDVAYMVEIVQTVTQIIRQKVEVDSSRNGVSEDKLTKRVKQIQQDYVVAHTSESKQMNKSMPGDLKALWERKNTLFLQLATVTNKALSELNLTKVKAAVLKHDSKQC